MSIAFNYRLLFSVWFVQHVPSMLVTLLLDRWTEWGVSVLLIRQVCQEWRGISKIKVSARRKLMLNCKREYNECSLTRLIGEKEVNKFIQYHQLGNTPTMLSHLYWINSDKLITILLNVVFVIWCAMPGSIHNAQSCMLCYQQPLPVNNSSLAFIICLRSCQAWEILR